MSITSGLRSGLISGLRSGLNPVHGATWSLDATSSKAMPANATEAAALLSSAGISATTLGLWLFGGAASGNISDSSGNGKTLTAGAGNGANVSYQQTVTGWTSKAIVMTANAAGRFDNNTFPNINASTPTLILYSQLTASGGTFSIMRYGTTFDDDCCMEQNATSNHIQGGEGDATRTAGTNDPIGQVRPFALSCGASVLLCSDQEAITVGTKAANGTMVTIGGDNTDTNWPNNGKHLMMWLLDTALSSAQIRTLFTTAGFTVAW